MDSSQQSGKNYLKIVSSFVGAKRWADAAAYGRRWVAEQPDSALAHCALAWTLIQIEQLDEAKTHALAALAIKPDTSWAHHTLGEVHYRQADYPAALAATREALALSPESPPLHALLARTLLNLGEAGEAYLAARQARELDPEDANYVHMNILLERMGATSPQSVYNEIAELKLTLALDPHNAHLLARIGQLYAEGLEDHAAAEDFLRQALQSDPTHRDYQNSLFDVVTQRDMVFRALGLPQRALGWVCRILRKNVVLVLGTLLAGIAATLPVGLWLAASLLLFYPVQKLYGWLILGDLIANRTGSLRFAHGLRALHRWPTWTRIVLLVALIAACWSVVFWVSMVPQIVGWLFAASAFSAYWLICNQRRHIRQSQAEQLARLSEAGVVLADLAPDDGVIRAELVDEPQPRASVVGAWQEMQEETRWLLATVVIGIALGLFGGLGGLGCWAVKVSGDRDALEVAEIVRDHPTIVEQLGGIDRCEFHLLQNLSDGSKSKQVFQVAGAKASGLLVAHEVFMSYDSIVLRIGDEEWELLEE